MGGFLLPIYLGDNMYDALDAYKEAREVRLAELHASIRWLRTNDYSKEEILQAIELFYPSPQAHSRDKT